MLAKPSPRNFGPSRHKFDLRKSARAQVMLEKACGFLRKVPRAALPIFA